MSSQPPSNSYCSSVYIVIFNLFILVFPLNSQCHWWPIKKKNQFKLFAWNNKTENSRNRMLALNNSCVIKPSLSVNSFFYITWRKILKVIMENHVSRLLLWLTSQLMSAVKKERSHFDLSNTTQPIACWCIPAIHIRNWSTYKLLCVMIFFLSIIFSVLHLKKTEKTLTQSCRFLQFQSN